MTIITYADYYSLAALDILVSIIMIALVILVEKYKLKYQRLKRYVLATDQKEKYLRWHEKFYEESAEKKRW